MVMPVRPVRLSRYAPSEHVARLTFSRVSPGRTPLQDESSGAHFEPLVQLAEVQVCTGEEDEEVLHSW